MTDVTVFRPRQEAVAVFGYGRELHVGLRPGEHVMTAFRRTAFAWARGDVTALPDYRQMLDTLRWEEIR